uniref:Uncharacterized protein n=1 Tax=Rhizophora mucronata TaxID=61149 RepID=A0A2P2NWG1_RHIMU
MLMDSKEFTTSPSVLHKAC